MWLPFIGAVIAFEAVADFMTKESALHGGIWRMGLAVVMVVAGNLARQFALRMGIGLARAGMI